MNVRQAEEGKEYLVERIHTDDEEPDSFLWQRKAEYELNAVAKKEPVNVSF